MTDIKELIRGILDAELVEQKGELEGLTLRQMNAVNAIAWNVAQRFLAAYLAEQEPVASVINTDNLYDIRWLDKIDVLLPHGAKLFTAPPLPEPAPQPAGKEDQAIYDAIATNYNKDTAPTKEQALEALDSMDDFARMADIDAIGPRKVLDDYINGAAPSSEEVREMVRWLRTGFGIYTTCEAADLIERLAARVPDGCVVVPREATTAMLNRANATEWDGMAFPHVVIWDAMIAAGEVKP